MYTTSHITYIYHFLLQFSHLILVYIDLYIVYSHSTQRNFSMAHVRAHTHNTYVSHIMAWPGIQYIIYIITRFACTAIAASAQFIEHTEKKRSKKEKEKVESADVYVTMRRVLLLLVWPCHCCQVNFLEGLYVTDFPCFFFFLPTNKLTVSKQVTSIKVFCITSKSYNFFFRQNSVFS